MPATELNLDQPDFNKNIDDFTIMTQCTMNSDKKYYNRLVSDEMNITISTTIIDRMPSTKPILPKRRPIKNSLHERFILLSIAFLFAYEQMIRVNHVHSHCVL